MKIFLTAGHKMYTGAKGILDETVVNREVVKNLSEILRNMGEEVTVVNSEASKDYVEEVTQANKGSYDWYLDIHCNAFNGNAHGVEVCVYRDDKPQAKSVCNNVAKLGFTNRGTKVRQDLYVLKNTKMKAMLVECFFIDSMQDCNTYKNVGARAIASAIAEGLTGKKYLGQPCPTCGK